MIIIDNFKLVEEIINNSDHINNDNYALFYLTAYGLIEQFGDKYLPLIKSLFDTTNFIVEVDDIESLCRETDFDVGEYSLDGLKALSSGGISFTIDEENFSFKIFKNNPKIICSSSGDVSFVLIEFVHEALHILKSLVNNISISDDGKSLAVRSGLYLDMTDISSDSVTEYTYNFLLDEIINVFQTTDVMKIISNIDTTVLPKSVLDFYMKLDLDKLVIPHGYEEYLELIEPLWNCESFKANINNGIILGDLSSIEEHFNKVVGEDIFGQMSYSLDELYLSDLCDEEYDDTTTYISDVVSSYLNNMNAMNRKVKQNKVDS